MNSEVKKYTVTILENSYTLFSDEPENIIMQAAQLVDSDMKELAYKTGNTSDTSIAVMSALKLSVKVLLLEKKTAKEQQCIQRMVHSISEILLPIENTV